MTEWNVYLVIVSLLGTALAIGAPVIRLNTTITKLIDKIDNLGGDLSELEASNRRSHERIHKKNDEQDKKLAEHETRIDVYKRQNHPCVCDFFYA